MFPPSPRASSVDSMDVSVNGMHAAKSRLGGSMLAGTLSRTHGYQRICSSLAAPAPGSAAAGGVLPWPRGDQ